MPGLDRDGPWGTRPRVNHARIQRPSAQRSSGSSQEPRVQAEPLLIRKTYSWSNRPEISVKILRLPEDATTWDIHRNFKREGGEIVMVEVYEDRNGRRQGTAKIRFSPPPLAPFWEKPSYTMIGAGEQHERVYNVNLEFDQRSMSRAYMVASPIRRGVSYPQKLKLDPICLDFGALLLPDVMMALKSVKPQEHPNHPKTLSFAVDLLKKRLVAHFSVFNEDPRKNGATDYVSDKSVGELDRVNQYMFHIPFGQLKTISRWNLGPEHNNEFALIITLDSPPQFYRKRQDEGATHSGLNLYWSEFDAWFRQTDIVYNPEGLERTPSMLQKEQPVIDIGRWTTYCWTFKQPVGNDVGTYDQMCRALEDYNINIIPLEKFHQCQPQAVGLWSWIDQPATSPAAHDLASLGTGESAIALPFEVRYQLEVCISQELINEHNISKEFVLILAKIAGRDPAKARNLLEWVAEQDKRIYDPLTIFDNTDALAHSSRTEIPHYCAYSRKARITPSSILFSSPTVETTNRVLRHYSRENHEGRFLRVQFTDEKFEGRINQSADKKRNDELFTRVYRTLFNGIRIGDRLYQFLAFGNSQFRENGAYFFCPTEHLSCNDIRHWMGSFGHINVVAKYAARLGQCFSTTRAIKGLSKPEIRIIDDIERNGFCFTDGVGKISPYLAQMIHADLGLPGTSPPSAFQFRLGGCKGMLVVSPDAKQNEVHIRKSQQKFQAVYNGLEIIRCSRFSCATLNRQTINILSALGVPDEVFVDMLIKQLFDYQEAMSNQLQALSLLSRHIDDNHMTLNIANMIQNGFMAADEPFFLSLLHLWRAWSIKLLKEKAKIIIEDGAFVFGCVDETGTLRGHIKPTIAPGQAYKESDLPQIFIQRPDKDDPSKYVVIEGLCVVGRNPSLHPGDIRVVQAVDVPALHHLRDVVVFPQLGERDVPSMCSGGDLDGDDFFVIWDQNLRPTEWNCEPMNYAAPKPKPINRPVQVADLMKFFVRFMKNDTLPTIAHAHMANSDLLTIGVKDVKCLELAQLHSKAVDYVKTGQAAEMPKRLRPAKWPHFMEKIYQPKDKQYHSQKVLGQLYDKVESVDFVPQYERPFDKRILKAYELDNAILKAARQVKSLYDVALRRIMAQQEIKTEFEVWSTFVLSKARTGGSGYKLQEEMGVISNAFKDQFRHVCIEKAGGKEFAVLGPFIAAMYRITKEEMDIALAECRAIKIVNGREVPKRKMNPKFMPLISFPWLFEKELGRIATGIEVDDLLADMNIVSLISKSGNIPRNRRPGVAMDAEDYVVQEDGGIVHRGELLDFFPEEDELDGDSDFDEARGEPSFKFGEDGSIVIDAAFGEVPEDFGGFSTGVEEVVPKRPLDGLISALDKHSDKKVESGYDSSTADNNLGIQSLDDTPINTPVNTDDETKVSGEEEEEGEIEEEEVVVLDTEESAFEKLIAMHQ